MPAIAESDEQRMLVYQGVVKGAAWSNPAAVTDAAEKLPDSFGNVITAMGESHSPLLADQRKWKQHGQSGIWVSDWLPHIAECVDDLAVIRSCWADGINHSGGVCQMNTCSTLGGRPSLGAWVTYGLGTENETIFVPPGSRVGVVRIVVRFRSMDPATTAPGPGPILDEASGCRGPPGIHDETEGRRLRGSPDDGRLWLASRSLPGPRSGTGGVLHCRGGGMRLG